MCKYKRQNVVAKKWITSRKAQASRMCSYPCHLSYTGITFHRYSWSGRHLLLVFGLSFIVEGLCILLNPLVYGVSHHVCNLLKMAFRHFFYWPVLTKYWTLMWEDNKAASQLCRWRGENNLELKVFSISTPWWLKDPQQNRSHIFIHTHTLLAVYLNVVCSKPAGVLLAAQGQNVEIHQHGKVPTL